MGVMKSAVRRASMIRCVGWPVASSSQCRSGHPYGLFRMGRVKNGLSKQSRILECNLENCLIAEFDRKIRQISF